MKCFNNLGKNENHSISERYSVSILKSKDFCSFLKIALLSKKVIILIFLSVNLLNIDASKLTLGFRGQIDSGLFLEEGAGYFELGKTFYYGTDLRGVIGYEGKTNLGVEVTANFNENRVRLRNFFFYYHPHSLFRLKSGIIDNDPGIERDASYLDRVDLIPNLITRHLIQTGHNSRGVGFAFYSSKGQKIVPLRYDAGLFFNDSNYLINAYALIEYKIKPRNMSAGIRWSHIHIPLSSMLTHREFDFQTGATAFEFYFYDYDGFLWEYIEFSFGQNSDSGNFLNYYGNKRGTWFIGGAGFIGGNLTFSSGTTSFRFGQKASFLLPDVEDINQWNFQTITTISVLPIPQIKVELSGGPVLAFYKLEDEYFRKIAVNVKLAGSFSFDWGILWNLFF